MATHQTSRGKEASKKSAKEVPALRKEKAEKQEKKQAAEEQHEEMLIRLYGYDLPGQKNIFAGLTRIKGVSWAIANAVCVRLQLPRSKRVHELSKEEMKKIEQFLDTLDVPEFLKNRRKDRETGTSEHLYGSDLDMKREFDIKRLKEIRSYRGIRHALKQPVRGQRTRSHFRAHKVAMVGRREKPAKVAA